MTDQEKTPEVKIQKEAYHFTNEGVTILASSQEEAEKEFAKITKKK